jgi:hypothetical protein
MVKVVYDESSKTWTPDPDVNRLFLDTMNNHLRDRLKARGHLFLNEVFDELDLPRTSEGQLKGWLYSEGDTIQLWTEIRHSEDASSIKILFEIDGVIYDKID